MKKEAIRRYFKTIVKFLFVNLLKMPKQLNSLMGWHVPYASLSLLLFASGSFGGQFVDNIPNRLRFSLRFVAVHSHKVV